MINGFETDLDRVFALQICQLFLIRNNQFCFDESRFNCTDKGWQSENNCTVYINMGHNL